MMGSSEVDDQQVFHYDVQLTRRPPDSLRAQYPDMTVRTTPAQTALRRRVAGPGELDALLCEIGTYGLTLTDLHKVVTRADHVEAVDDHGARNDAVNPVQSRATYEVRVVGELGMPLLRHLGCAHYSVPEQTLVRLRLVAGELNRFLQACTACGARLERLRRVGSSQLVRG